MSHRFRAILIISALFTLLAPPGTALATDNTTKWHQHNRVHAYYINTNFPSAWKPAVREAGKAWSDRTKLRFSYAGLTPTTNPTGSPKIVWRGAIPSAWQAGCPPDEALACTRWTYYTTTNHITDVDTVFNSRESMGTSDTNCFLGIGYDVQTVALHEFGHWGVLTHTDDILGSVMSADYFGCVRTPTGHDIDSMNLQYAGH